VTINSGTRLTGLFAIICIIIIGLIVYKYKEEIIDMANLAILKLRGQNYSRNTKSSDYHFIPNESDTSALVSNEPQFDPPEQSLRINV
jgi:hypothetical protein